jgi:tetratricopeptide (TPR) repeat protein
MPTAGRRPAPAAALLALVLALAALFAAAPAGADDADTRAAKKHFQKGQKLFDLGRFDDALVEYEAAYQRKPLPGFLYNIAQCHRNLGNLKQAIFGFRNYLRQVPAAANRDAVLELIDELEAEQREREERAERERAERAPPPPPPRRRAPFYKRGWFWGGVAVVTAAAVGAVVLTGGDGAPATDLGNVDFD